MSRGRGMGEGGTLSGGMAPVKKGFLLFRIEKAFRTGPCASFYFNPAFFFCWHDVGNVGSVE